MRDSVSSSAMRALLEAIVIREGKIEMVEVPGMPARTLRVKALYDNNDVKTPGVVKTAVAAG